MSDRLSETIQRLLDASKMANSYPVNATLCVSAPEVKGFVVTEITVPDLLFAAQELTAASTSQASAHGEIVKLRTDKAVASVAISCLQVDNACLLSDLAMARSHIKELEAHLNTPELHDFAKGVVAEAQHQRARWGGAARRRQVQHRLVLAGWISRGQGVALVGGAVRGRP